MRSQYRPDIDGLRAISAIAVVLFHAHVPGFRGGFIGVDVFFVISGYLITRLLCEPGEQSVRRRLAEFYIRRCRRVLPALLVLLVILTLAAIILLRPADLHIYGKYLASTSILLTNVVAWADRNAGWPPLIHLWTIAVEEQFYLLYPLLLLWATTRLTRPIVPIALFAVASFTLSVWAAYAMPLYLWHAPLLALFYYRTGASANGVQTALLLSATWLLALVSWFAVERPVRSGTLFKSDRRFLIASLVANFALGGAGLCLWRAYVF